MRSVVATYQAGDHLLRGRLFGLREGGQLCGGREALAAGGFVRRDRGQAFGVDVLHDLLKGLTRNVYITIDIDVLDPSVMPSTGTPEPGGLDWYTLMGLLTAVITNRNVVGMDVTELLPNPDNRAPDFLVAKLIYRCLSMVFAPSKTD